MPFALPQNFGDANWEAREAGVKVDPAIYPITIFNVEPTKTNKGDEAYDVTVRIDGGDFDGVDVKDSKVTLTQKAIFRMHDILKAVGTLDTYYERNADGKGGRWVALPTPDELIGKKAQAQIEQREFQSTDRNTGAPLTNADGSPLMATTNDVTGYFPLGENVAFRPRQRAAAPAAPAAPGFPPAGPGFPGQQGGGIPTGGAFPGQVTGIPQGYPTAAPAQPQGQPQPQQGGFPGSVAAAGQRPW